MSVTVAGLSVRTDGAGSRPLHQVGFSSTVGAEAGHRSKGLHAAQESVLPAERYRRAASRGPRNGIAGLLDSQLLLNPLHGRRSIVCVS